MYFRLNSSGQKISTTPNFNSSKIQKTPRRGLVFKKFHNLQGTIGPQTGDMARSHQGLIDGDLQIETHGDRLAGLGRQWERVHLIGVSAGNLHKRRYSNYNTLIGSHALNTAMIPFEAMVKNILTRCQSFVYTVNVDKVRIIKFIDKNGNEREESVPYELRQSISYTSPSNDNAWLNIEQKHVDGFVEKMKNYSVIEYEPNIKPEFMMSKDNFNQVKGKIKLINEQIKALKLHK